MNCGFISSGQVISALAEAGTTFGADPPEIFSETDIAGLGVVCFIVDIDDPLFPVDDRIFSIRGESHDREFAAVALVVFHVIASGLLVCSEEDPDPAF